MDIRKAILKSFNSTPYTAVVKLIGSHTAYLEDIAVSRDIAAVDMVIGRNVAVILFDESNPTDAVVIAVYT